MIAGRLVVDGDRLKLVMAFFLKNAASAQERINGAYGYPRQAAGSIFIKLQRIFNPDYIINLTSNVDNESIPLIK
jgi:hypothetical protein